MRKTLKLCLNHLPNFLARWLTEWAAFFRTGRIVRVHKAEEFWLYTSSENTVISHRFHINPFSVTKDNFELFTREYVPKMGDIVFDVGSGLGNELILFSQKVGSKGLVFGVEADPRAVAMSEIIVGFSDKKMCNWCLSLFPVTRNPYIFHRVEMPAFLTRPLL
jgi:SAM-dependent methyltransferase